MDDQQGDVFDLESITIGEMLEVEIASHLEFGDLVRSRTGTMMIVLFLRHLRAHGQPLEWSQIASLPLRDSYKLVSVSKPDGPSQT